MNNEKINVGHIDLHETVNKLLSKNGIEKLDLDRHIEDSVYLLAIAMKQQETIDNLVDDVKRLKEIDRMEKTEDGKVQVVEFIAGSDIDHVCEKIIEISIKESCVTLTKFNGINILANAFSKKDDLVSDYMVKMGDIKPFQDKKEA